MAYTLEERRQYQQVWREEHPHYSRDYAREKLGAKPRKLGRKERMPVILGVRIRTDLLEHDFVETSIGERGNGNS
jgi:hypothetical protein